MLKRTENVRVRDMESFDMIDTVGKYHVLVFELFWLFGAGFAGKKNDKAKEKLETEIKRNKPDVLIVVTSAMNLAREHDARMLEKSIVDVKKMIYSIWKFHIPIVFVFHRIDELFVPQGDWEQYCHSLDNNANLMPTVQEMLSSNLPSFKADNNKFLCITATRWQHHYGIQRLINMVTANTDIQNIIPKNSERFYRHYRRTTAARIISAFSGFNSVVGGLPLPGVDILITNRMIDIMLNLLALLAVNPNRTAKTYRAVYETAFGLISLGRYVMLALAKGFEFTGVGIPIGIAVGATAGGGTTALVGWQAYEYFTEEKINAPE